MSRIKSKIPIALCYDFDGTLAPGNMQEHSYIPNLGISKEAFWNEAKAIAKANDMNEIMAYMHLMLKKANALDKPVRRKDFSEGGKGIQFFPGVETWFQRINDFGKEHNLDVHHFIISSGLREMVEGTRIAKNFKYVFASGFYYNASGVAEWPALGIDYTQKTQFLFRINKGIINSWDNSLINKYMPEQDRPYPFNRIIYIGDGETDIPAMKMVNFQGGYSIAVFDPNKRKTKTKPSAKEISQDLLKHKRTQFISPADYSENSDLENLLKNILNDIHYKYQLEIHNRKHDGQK